ncbi:MAG: glycerol-3-phosphate acyltransferase [Clostridia bacterium]|nr:glycerol-3-phosphate acyltransferase [Clostridia bacterium]
MSLLLLLIAAYLIGSFPSELVLVRSVRVESDHTKYPYSFFYILQEFGLHGAVIYEGVNLLKGILLAHLVMAEQPSNLWATIPVGVAGLVGSRFNPWINTTRGGTFSLALGFMAVIGTPASQLSAALLLAILIAARRLDRALFVAGVAMLVGSLCYGCPLPVALTALSFFLIITISYQSLHLVSHPNRGPYNVMGPHRGQRAYKE